MISDKNISRVAVVPMKNYTDVPMAGLRATNLLVGILRAQNVAVTPMTDRKIKETKGYCRKASEKGIRYLMGGGVSEWRYKTGIDGEPAVSFQVSLHDCEKDTVVWSGTASSNDYWRASIGTTAQATMQELLR